MLFHYGINFCLHSLDLVLQLGQFLHIVRVLIDIILWSWLIRSSRLLTLLLIGDRALVFGTNGYTRITSLWIGHATALIHL